jgi:NAD(P)-dependent dehydrogenase (short-subunit alcohol dehydrogenase family)
MMPAEEKTAEGRMAGRVAIVTGARRGFGRATAKRLLEEGASVALWDLEEAAVERAAMELAELGPTLGLGVDVGDRDQVQAAAALTRAELGPVDALVNNAGIASSALPWEAEEESWRRHFRINADGTWWCIQACLPDMRERGYGKIVNIGSLSAQQGRPATDPAYPASKGAVLGLTVSLAHNLGADGICVNAINPGYIRTEIHDAFSEEQLATLAADVPLHRDGVKGGGLPIDIANAALFLLSAESDYITGEFLSVNGGSRTGS